MAISVRATSANWTEFTGSSVVGVAPAGGLAGDMLFFWLVWKNQSVTASSATGNLIKLAEFKDGTVAAAAGVGSVTIAVYYKVIATTGESTGTVTLSGAVGVGAWCIQILQLGAGETWNAPTFVSAAWPATAANQTVDASSTTTVPASSVVMGCIGIADDTATFTRAATSISAVSGVTWNGNYVESPATHRSTTTGNDMAADLGHRFVTSGGAGITLQQQATLAAADTGSIVWVTQDVSVAGGATSLWPPARRPNYGSLIQL
jgi:hypothetical protein